MFLSLHKSNINSIFLTKFFLNLIGKKYRECCKFLLDWLENWNMKHKGIRV